MMVSIGASRVCWVFRPVKLEMSFTLPPKVWAGCCAAPTVSTTAELVDVIFIVLVVLWKQEKI